MGKAHSSYTVSDIKRLDLSFLKKEATEEQIGKMRANIDYIARISNDMGHATFGRKPFLETFTKPFYEYEKNELNQVILTALTADQEASKQAVAPEVQLATLKEHEVKDIFKDNRANTIASDITSLEDSMQHYTQEAEHYFTTAQEKLVQRSEKEKERDELEEVLSTLDPDGRNEVVLEQIQKVIESGEWVYMGSYHQDEGIRFKTYPRTLRDEPRNSSPVNLHGHVFLSAKPIVHSYVNHSANVSMSMDFGHLMIALGDDGATIQNRFVINTIGNQSNCHPHLSSNSLCWGTAGSRYSNLISVSNPNFLGVMSLVKALLETYCPDNPYVSFTTIYKHRNKRIPNCLPLDLLANVPPNIFSPEIKADIEHWMATEALTEKFREEYHRYSTHTTPSSYEGTQDVIDRYTKVFGKELAEKINGAMEATLVSFVDYELSATRYDDDGNNRPIEGMLPLIFEQMGNLGVEKFTAEEIELIKEVPMRIFTSSQKVAFIMWCLYSGMDDMYCYFNTGYTDRRIAKLSLAKLVRYGTSNGRECVRLSTNFYPLAGDIGAYDYRSLLVNIIALGITPPQAVIDHETTTETSNENND